jgi:hypothetical protein
MHQTGNLANVLVVEEGQVGEEGDAILSQGIRYTKHLLPLPVAVVNKSSADIDASPTCSESTLKSVNIYL